MAQLQPAYEDLIDLRSMISSIRRRFKLFMAIALLTFLGVAFVTVTTTPVYTATSSVVVNTPQSQVVDIEAVLSVMPQETEMVDTEVELLRSRALAERVTQRLNLIEVAEFNRALQPPGLFDQFKSLIGIKAPDNDPEDNFNGVVSTLLNARGISRAGETYVVEISITSQSPQLARDIANAYTDAYLEAQLAAKNAANTRANEFLNERVQALREEVREREQAVESFREEAGLINADGLTIAEQQVTDLNAQLAVQRAELSEARARLQAVQDQLERGVAADTIAEVLGSSVILELRSQQAEVARREADLSGRYGPRHPQMINVQREMADINQQIEDEIQRIVASLQNEVNVSTQGVRSIESSLASARRDLADSNSSVVRLRELEREAEASRALFESFLARSRQTIEAEALTEADAKIVSLASIPQNPSAPKVLLNLVFGGIFASVSGLGCIFIISMLDNGITTETDIENNFQLPHIASVPRIKLSLSQRWLRKTVVPHKYLIDKPMSRFAESHWMIRSAIRMSEMDSELSVIAVTSALPGDGKTTTSLCLSHVFASAGASTIVVDCDLRRRRLSQSVSKNVDYGILEVLSSNASLDATILKSNELNVDVLPVASNNSFVPRDVFSSTVFENLLKELRVRYDRVILDSPPILAIADARTIARYANGVLVVAKWKSSADVVGRAIHDLRSMDANILGVALSNVDLAVQARYDYSVPGKVTKSYDKYFVD